MLEKEIKQALPDVKIGDWQKMDHICSGRWHQSRWNDDKCKLFVLNANAICVCSDHKTFEYVKNMVDVAKAKKEKERCKKRVEVETKLKEALFPDVVLVSYSKYDDVITDGDVLVEDHSQCTKIRCKNLYFGGGSYNFPTGDFECESLFLYNPIQEDFLKSGKYKEVFTFWSNEHAKMGFFGCCKHIWEIIEKFKYDLLMC